MEERMEGRVVPLDGGWRIRRADRVDADGTELSDPEAVLPGGGGDGGEDGWTAAEVPGTVLGALVEAGVCPDPFHGHGNAEIPDLAEEDDPRLYTYWWVRSFDLPPRSGGDRVWLDLHGVNHRADVFVDGRAVAEGLEGTFLRHVLDVTAVARSGANRVAVRVVPPWPPGVHDPDREGGDPGAPNLGRSVTLRAAVGGVRQPPVRDRNAGLWRRAEVRVTGPLRLRHPHVVTYVLGPDGRVGDKASVLIAAEIDNPGAEERHARLSAHLVDTGQVVERSVVLPPGGRGPVALPDLAVMFPHLWWPAGMGGDGPRSLYTVDLQLTVEGVLSDRRRVRFGIREIGWRRRDLTDGAGGVLSVNGRDVFLRGGTWSGVDALLRRRHRTPRRYRDELRLHAEAGINLLRLPAAAAAESDAFFDACDEHGLLVMHDFWRTAEFDGPYPDGWADRFLRSARDTVRRLRNHPSLALWCGGDRVETAGLTGAREVVDRCLRCHVEGRDREGRPCRFTGSSPCTGAGVLDGTRPYVSSSTEMEGVLGLAAPLPDGAADDDGTALAGLHRQQARCEAAAARLGSAATGLVLGPTQEAWPGTGGVLYDWRLRQRGGYWGVRRTAGPLHLQLGAAGGDAVVLLVNRGAADAAGTAEVAVHDPRGRELWADAIEIEAAAGTVSEPAPLALPVDLPPLHLVALTFRDADGAVRGRHLDWRAAGGAAELAARLEDLAALPGVELEVAATLQRDGGEVRLDATLRNPAGGPVAAGVRLRLLRGDGDVESGEAAPIHPAFLSDDHFSLLPGEEVRITARCAEDAAGDADPVLEVGGINVEGARAIR
jgi:hypothetical protein